MYSSRTSGSAAVVASMRRGRGHDTRGMLDQHFCEFYNTGISHRITPCAANFKNYIIFHLGLFYLSIL